METRFLLIVTILFVSLFSSIAFLSATQNQPSASSLTTQQLTDDALTVYDADNPKIVAGENSAHVIWSEYLVYKPLTSDFDSDMFYVQLPLGQVHHLKATTGTVSSLYYDDYPQIALDSNDNPHIVWSEVARDIGSDWESRDLFYWTTGMQSPQNISHNQATGDVGNILIVIDETDVPHVLWAESIDVWAYESAIFYWTEGSNTVKLADTIIDNGDFNVTNVVGLVAQDGVIHALWKNWTPFYWNSDTQTAVDLNDGTGSWDTAIDDYFLNQSGAFYVLWRQDTGPSNYPIDYQIWDSISGQNHLIVSSLNYVETQLFKSNAGTAHILWGEQTNTTYYWNSVSQTSVEIVDDAIAAVEGTTGDHIHLAWAKEDANWPGHETDMFYWRSDWVDPINVTDHTQPAASVGAVRLWIDETDTAYIVWDEGGTSYYSNANGVTSVFTRTLNLEDIKAIEFDEPITLGTWRNNAVTAVADTAYILLDTVGASTTPFSVWELPADTVVPVTAVSDPIDPDDAIIWRDSNEDIHVAWLDDTTWDLKLQYWNATTGSQDLTNGHVDLDSHIIRTVTDTSGHVYLAWAEYYDGQTDMYAAYTPLNFTDFVYLPLVVK